MPQHHEEEEDLNAPPRAVRHKLQEERASITHKFNVGGHEGYITVGLYPERRARRALHHHGQRRLDGQRPDGQLRLAVSIALQHGVPLKLFCEKFAHTRFEPSGWSGNPDIGFAKSIMDYIFRWLQLRFLTGQQQLLFDNLRPRALADHRSRK
jgi:ribonucleoside-diphosphate reductase alpha chain